MCIYLHASSQACHLNWKKERYRLNVHNCLKLRTEERQTSWLFTIMPDRTAEQGSAEQQLHLIDLNEIWTGLEPVPNETSLFSEHNKKACNWTDFRRKRVFRYFFSLYFCFTFTYQHKDRFFCWLQSDSPKTSACTQSAHLKIKNANRVRDHTFYEILFRDTY